MYKRCTELDSSAITRLLPKKVTELRLPDGRGMDGGSRILEDLGSPSA